MDKHRTEQWLADLVVIHDAPASGPMKLYIQVGSETFEVPTVAQEGVRVVLSAVVLERKPVTEDAKSAGAAALAYANKERPKLEALDDALSQVKA